MPRNTFMQDEIIERKFDLRQLARLSRYVFEHKFELYVGLFLTICVAACSLTGPYVLKILYDDMITTGNIKGIIIVIAVYIGILLLQLALNIRRAILVNRLGHSVVYKLRRDLFSHLQRLSFKFFDDRPTGKILVRLTNYIDSISSLLSDGLLGMISDTLSLFFIIVILFAINARLTVVSILTCIPLFIIVFSFRGVIKKRRIIMNHKISNRTAYVHENIMGSKIIQSFCRQAENLKIYQKVNWEAADTWLAVVRVRLMFFPFIDITGNMGIAIIYFLGYKMLIDGSITLGTIIAFTGYIGMFWKPINNISAVYNQMLFVMANIESVFDILTEPPDIIDAPDAVTLPAIKGEITFENVTFGYEDNTVLENLSFTIHGGESVALVGPTGGGKTTVVSLISRFYETNFGRVLIDGYDVNKVTLNSLRTQMGVMMQDTFVFEGTILDNIRYGKPDATDGECISAAEAIYANEFIEKLKDGYYTKVSERGSELSTGERQLLSFARVVVSDPAILILDEATSSIDTKTEKVIQLALGKLLDGRTSIIIAHRLSTIKRCDRIFYIDDKGIVEQGSHDELMEKRGRYYELTQAQNAFAQNSFTQTANV